MKVSSFIYFIALILSTLSYTSYSQVKNLNFKQLNPSSEAGFNKRTINDIIQDNRGFIWFASFGGLKRFDGYTIKSYTSKINDSTSISNNNVRALYEDKEGFIWIATQGGGLNKFNKITETFTRYLHDPKNKNSISDNDVWTIFECSKGFLWFGTYQEGLNKYDRNTDKFIAYKHDPHDSNSLSYGPIMDICEDKDGNLWIATDGGGLNKFSKEEKKFIHYQNQAKNKNSISNNSASTILEDSQGYIWVGCRYGGLNRFNNNTAKFERFNVNQDLKNNPLNDVFALKEDINGNLWIGTNGGIRILNKERKEIALYQNNPRHKNTLSNNQIRVIFEDQDNTIWIGNEAGGINKVFKTKNFKHFKKDKNNPKGLSHNVIRCFYEDPINKDIVWVGTFGGGLNIFNTKTEEFNLYKHSKIPDDSLMNISAFMRDSKENLWIGVWDNGIYKVNNRNEVWHFSHNSNDELSISDNRIQLIYEDKSGKIWVGTEVGLNQFNPKSNSWIHFKHDQNNIENSLNADNLQSKAFLEDEDGNLWIGNWEGFNKYSRNTGNFKGWKKNEKSPKNSLSNNHIISIHKDKKGYLWLGTFGGGLNKFNIETEEISYYTDNDGLTDNTIYGILEDEIGNLWLSTNNGLSKFNPETELFKNYDQSEGLQANEFFWGAAYKLSSGEMLFGGKNGFNLFNPMKIIDNEKIPSVVVTDFKRYNESVSLDSSVTEKNKIVLSYKENQFSIEFAALNYSSTEKNLYSYKLEGFDKEWINNGKSRVASYTNLDGGNYIFRVKGSNNDGKWNEVGHSIKIKIIPPFWETLWFQSLSVFLFLSSGVVFYKLRMRRIKLQKKQLEQTVKDRTYELRTAYGELNNQKQEIQSQNEELQQQAEELEMQRDYLEAQKNKLEDAYSLIETKNEHITNSIQYAKLIQQAILPSNEILSKFLTDYFIIYKPKDIVSGDFYWFLPIPEENIFFIAVADCTGHGVPGAFMSMIGSRLLNEIVAEKKIYAPTEILKTLHRYVREALRQDTHIEESTPDGMDISLLCIKNKQNTLVADFSGAKSNLYYFDSNTKNFQTIAGDRISIGGKDLKERNFTNHNLPLNKGDQLYLTTDGIIDQNNHNRKRFGSTKFSEIIKENLLQSMSQQKNEIEIALNEFQFNEEQRDDIAVMGIIL